MKYQISPAIGVLDVSTIKPEHWLALLRPMDVTVSDDILVIYKC